MENNDFLRFIIILISLVITGCINEEVAVNDRVITTTTSTIKINQISMLVNQTLEKRDLDTCNEDLPYENYSNIIMHPESCIIKTLDQINTVLDCKALPRVQKRLCIHHLAKRTKDISVCNEFKNEVHYNQCREHLGKSSA